MNSKLVVISTFNNPIEAHIIKGLLESNGIETCIFDENIVYTNPVLTTAVGRIRLMIHEEDFEDAIKLLETEQEEKLDEEKLVCPKCNSSNIEIKKITNWKAFLLMSWSFSFTPNGGNRSVYECQHCGYEWE